jgi:hypothetical protein
VGTPQVMLMEKRKIKLRTFVNVYYQLSVVLAHTTIDWRELGIPSALPYISSRSVD